MGFWQDLVRLEAEEVNCAHMSSCFRLALSLQNYWNNPVLKFSLWWCWIWRCF